MREILFRGKRKSDGKWLIGMYSDARMCDADFACIAPLRGCNEYMDWSIIPETVGQYTGFVDRNGKKIFEGDILESSYDGDHPDDVCYEQVCGVDNGWHIQELPSFEPDMLDGGCELFSVVIGNIHDNPELLQKMEGNNDGGGI